MNMLRLILLVFILIAFPSCNSNAQNSGILTKEQLIEDLRQLKKILESDHPQLYRFTSEEEFDTLYNLAEESFYYSMDIVEAFKHFGRIVGAVGCGHTRISMPDGFWESNPDGYLPMEVMIADNKVLVMRILSENSEIEVGAELLEINSTPIIEVVEQLRRYSTGDGLWNSRRDFMAGKYFAYRIAAFKGFPGEYSIVFRNPRSQRTSQEVIKSVQSYKIDNPDAPGKHFEWRTDLPENTSCLAIRTFGYYDDVDGFRGTIDKAFTEINAAGSKNLILDLRGNSGGDPHCSTHLMSYIIAEPIPYFGKKFFGYQAYADPLPVFKDSFRGKIFVLIDGGCFSTTGHLTSLLKYHKFATFIGEETGGTCTCNDASREFTLKNTGFKGMVARRTFYTAVEGMSWAEGVQPDYKVYPKAIDIINGNDTVLDFAIKLIKDQIDK